MNQQIFDLASSEIEDQLSVAIPCTESAEDGRILQIGIEILEKDASPQNIHGALKLLLDAVKESGKKHCVRLSEPLGIDSCKFGEGKIRELYT